MKYKIFFSLLFLFFIATNSLKAQKSLSDFKTENFEFQGHNAKIVFPKNADNNRNWIWRARFWNHQPQVDIALLEKGFHLVYIDVAGLYGNAEAVNLWNSFYDFARNKYSLNSKVVLEGMSRGGLIVYNWASKNTEKVACIYADAPVCDIKSWPGGMGAGVGSYFDWSMCLQAYGLDEKSVLDFKDMPINNCKEIAKAKIPVIHVCGDKDKYVPYTENTEIVKEKIEQNGGIIEVIIKKGAGHHPHSLQNPKQIVDFILKSIA